MGKSDSLFKYNFKKEVIGKSVSHSTVSTKSSDKNSRFQPLSFLSDSEESSKSKHNSQKSLERKISNGGRDHEKEGKTMKSETKNKLSLSKSHSSDKIKNNVLKNDKTNSFKTKDKTITTPSECTPSKYSNIFEKYAFYNPKKDDGVKNADMSDKSISLTKDNTHDKNNSPKKINNCSKSMKVGEKVGGGSEKVNFDKKDRIMNGGEEKKGGRVNEEKDLVSKNKGMKSEIKEGMWMNGENERKNDKNEVEDKMKERKEVNTFIVTSPKKDTNIITSPKKDTNRNIKKDTEKPIEITKKDAVKQTHTNKKVDSDRQIKEKQIHTMKKTEADKQIDTDTQEDSEKHTNKRKIQSSPLPSPIMPSSKKRKIIMSSDDDDDDDDGADDDDGGFIEGVGESGLCEKLIVNNSKCGSAKTTGSSQLSGSDQSTASQEKRHNLGSLKAFSWVRTQEKLNRSQEDKQADKKTEKKKLRRLRIIDDDEEEEEEEDVIKKKSTKDKLKKHKIDDDDEDVFKTKDYNKNNDDDDDDDDGGDDDDDDDFGEGMDKKGILDFLNASSVDELVSLGGCSRKKADVVVSMRPYTDWSDLLSKLDSNKMMGRWVVEECGEVLRLRAVVRGLMDRCIVISKNLQSAVTALQGNGKGSLSEVSNAFNSRGYLNKQPGILNHSLKLANYQLVGLNWLVMMHKQKLNGILGDEMGLGKTIQTIAFLAYLLEHNYQRPHVIVSPSSTIDNWLRELKLWCPALTVLPYYGSQEERKEMRMQMVKGECDVDVVLTSYNMAASTAEDRLLFKKVSFAYAIFDEGHMLKNMTTTRYKSLLKISAQRRLLLTGTPLQNNLLELISLLSFVMPDIFAGNTESLKKIFSQGEKNTTKTNTDSDKGANKQTNKGANKDTNKDTNRKGSYEQETLENAKKILQPFFLRRLKKDVLDQLPSKTQRVVKVPMPTAQKTLYDRLLKRYASEYKRSKENNLENNNGGSAVMMNLRKAANHPLLHRVHYTDEVLRHLAKNIIKDKEYRDCSIDCIYEDMQVMSDFELHNLCLKSKAIKDKCLEAEVVCQSAKFKHLDVLLPKLHQQGDRVLFFSQFTMVLDIVEVYLTERGHKYIRLDGSTRVADRQDLIDDFNDDSGIFIFLLSTKAGGIGINLTSANVVIIHDPDFNPYNDKQAEDRCHRVGQKRDVTVYKLLTEATVEDGIHRCALRKLKLEKDVTNTDNQDAESADVAMLLREALNVKG